MATGLPAGQTLDIEFTAGTWTPVANDVLFMDGISITRGRNSVFSTASVGTMTVTLDNAGTKGKYTPLRQVLTDGTTHPFWPNVIPRRRIRYVNTLAGTRFLGYIRSFPPSMKNGVLPQVTLVADDRLKMLDKAALVSPVVQEQLNDGPAVMWVLNDAAFSTTAAERLSGSQLTLKGTGPSPLFGGAAINSSEGTTATFNPSGAAVGQVLGGTISVATPTVEAWINAGSSLPSWGTGSQIQYFLGCGAGFGSAISLGLQGGVAYYSDAATTVTGGPNLADGKWHHVAVAGAVGAVATLYVDGVAVATSGATRANVTYTRVILGANPDAFGLGFGVSLYQGQLASVTLYPSSTVPSGTRLAAHAAAGTGYAGDTTGTRIQRYLTAAGLTSADWNLDPGVAKVGTYPQAGVSVLNACQAMVDTEGGGSVVYIAPDGRVRFTDRNFRKPGTVAMTMDAVTDLAQSGPFSPDFSDEGLFNSSTVPRANAGGVISTQTSADTNSKSTFFASADPGVTSYATTDTDALDLAQWRVAINRTPGYRLPQIAVDLMTAENNLYAALGAVEIGKRVRITNLPAAAAPSNQLDCIVEGWTETITPDSYLVQFDLSPADNPAFMVWGGGGAYSRWQAQGQTLNTTITASGTTVKIDTSAGNPTLTTSAGAYPMTVQIDQEVMTFPNAPSGSTSPQTFTGVQRGTQGTPQAAHTAGAVFQLWPASTWSL